MNDDRLPDAGEATPGAQGRSLSASEAQSLLPAFVLGALEPDEMLAVEAFLQAHPEWQKRLSDLEVTAASLAHAAPRAALPAHAKERLRQRVEDALPLNATLAPPPYPPEATPSWPQSFFRNRTALPAPGSSLRGMRQIPPPKPQVADQAPNWFGIFWRSVASAGAVAAIILLGGIALQLRNNVMQLSSQVAALQSDLEQIQRTNVELLQTNQSLRQELAQQEAQLAVLTNPDQTIALAGTPVAPAASGDFVRRGAMAVLTLRGLPPLPAGQTYQLWFLPPEGASIPADLLNVSGAESETMAVAVAPQYQDLAGVGVSIEPVGGSQTPTDIVLLGTTTPNA